jgi:hemerythrin-like metal-binding protein
MFRRSLIPTGLTLLKVGEREYPYALENFLETDMTTLQWSDSFTLDIPFMDDTHREFIDLLATVVTAPDAELLPAWKILIDHTDAHFGREDQWMLDTRFAATNCHSTQHKIILQVLREGDVRGLAGELDVVRQMASELGIWFPQHAHSMDTALANHLRNVGYDAATGLIHSPQALPTEEIHGCAGESCSPVSPTDQTLAAVAA